MRINPLPSPNIRAPNITCSSCGSLQYIGNMYHSRGSGAECSGEGVNDGVFKWVSRGSVGL